MWIYRIKAFSLKAASSKMSVNYSAFELQPLHITPDSFTSNSLSGIHTFYCQRIAGVGIITTVH